MPTERKTTAAQVIVAVLFFVVLPLDVLLHVCTHAQYTVAQVVNMLRQVGVEKLPETMLISLARMEASQP